MYSSKVTQKGQATIPFEIRNKLNIHKGDSVGFDLNKHGDVVLHKVEPIDVMFLQSLNAPLSDEWNSDEDSGAYNDL
jgi:AbrB family looped-hinge helix DNA binding protein